MERFHFRAKGDRMKVSLISQGTHRYNGVWLTTGVPLLSELASM